jgi:hypothetical protein
MELRGPKIELKIMRDISRLKLVAFRASCRLSTGSSFGPHSTCDIKDGGPELGLCIHSSIRSESESGRDQNRARLAVDEPLVNLDGYHRHLTQTNVHAQVINHGERKEKLKLRGERGEGNDDKLCLKRDSSRSGGCQYADHFNFN